MPYIAPNDRQALDPLIRALQKKICALRILALGEEHFSNRIFLEGHMRYIAERVLIKASLDAAEQYQGNRNTRYWLIVNHAGVAFNVAFELWDRVLSKWNCQSPPLFTPNLTMVPVPPQVDFLDPEIDALIEKIKECSGPSGHNYPSAYCGLVNYSMTELMPRIIMDADDTGKCFDEADAVGLLSFWFRFARTIYSEVARPYEDEQIVKNGDVFVYHLMRQRLGIEN